MNRLVELDVEVVGVSGDEVKNHQLFKKVHDLNYTLLSDEKGEVAQKFGVPVKEGGVFETEIDGEKVALKRGVTCSRWTFVIDQERKIVLKNTTVKAAEDSKQVLELIEALKKK
jgi:peroxiredoxin Q/BCP